MKQLISLLFLVFCFSCSKSQDSTFQFISNKIDIGELRVTDKVTPFKFIAVNNTNNKVVIDTVLTSCNCFKPKLNKTTIAKGDTLLITLPFDPINKTGVVNDEVKLVIQKDTIGLLLTGVVRAEVEKDLQYNFNEKIGGCVLIEKRAVNFNTISKREVKIKKLRAFNSCSKSIKLQSINHNHEHLEITSLDSIIQPNKFFSWDLHISPSFIDEYGYRSDDIELLILMDSLLKFPIKVNSALTNDFNKDSLKKPSFKVDKSIKEFSKVKSGQIIEESFIIRNEGLGDLKLLSVKPTCDCVTTDFTSNIIMPNNELALKVSFNTKGRSGYQRKTIVILTNDPLRPYIQLQFNGKVLSN